MGVKIVHPSIDDDSEATDSDKEENNDENAQKTSYYGENMNYSSDDEGNNDEDVPYKPYDGENMNAFSDDEGNNDEDAPKNPYNGKNINDYYNNEGNNDEVSPDPPTNEVNVNDNYYDGEMITRLSLIHLQMVEIMKQLTTTKKKMQNRMRRKQVIKT